ncbi:hypothetical protein BLNAU_1252 [Blattamonas nauphoetae]|uniref:Uncharacterized protein n=1 Tax=Blattamonas nauphoetae TaxID=2049346 RepID=A0ABQ9YIY2_9EUKA|nr:hypothetical protein BLNAU_1252 [Blattamonas nauphoetae]
MNLSQPTQSLPPSSLHSSQHRLTSPTTLPNIPPSPNRPPSGPQPSLNQSQSTPDLNSPHSSSASEKHSPTVSTPISVFERKADNVALEPFSDIYIPFLAIGDEKFLYLEIYQRFVNPQVLLFGEDMSFFAYFPFRGKQLLNSLRKSHNRAPSSPSPNSYTLYETFLLHYFDALHIQFYTILAQSAHYLGHYWIAMMCIRQARLYQSMLQDLIGNVNHLKMDMGTRLKEPFKAVSELYTKFMELLALAKKQKASQSNKPSPSDTEAKWSDPNLPLLHEPIPFSTMTENPTALRFIFQLMFSTAISIGLPLTPSEIMESCMLLEYLKGTTLLALFFTSNSNFRSRLLMSDVSEIQKISYLRSLREDLWNPFHHVFTHPDRLPPYPQTRFCVMPLNVDIHSFAKSLVTLRAHWKANNGRVPEEDAEEDLRLRTAIRERIDDSLLLNDPNSSLMGIGTKSVFNEQFNRQTRVGAKMVNFLVRNVRGYSCEACSNESPSQNNDEEEFGKPRQGMFRERNEADTIEAETNIKMDVDEINEENDPNQPSNSSRGDSTSLQNAPQSLSTFASLLETASFLGDVYTLSTQLNDDGIADIVRRYPHIKGRKKLTDTRFDPSQHNFDLPLKHSMRTSPLGKLYEHLILTHMKLINSQKSSEEILDVTPAFFQYSLRQLQQANVWLNSSHDQNKLVGTRIHHAFQAVLAAEHDLLMCMLEAVCSTSRLIESTGLVNEKPILVVCGGNERWSWNGTENVVTDTLRMTPLHLTIWKGIEKPYIVVANPSSPIFPFVDVSSIPSDLEVCDHISLPLPSAFLSHLTSHAPTDHPAAPLSTPFEFKHHRRYACRPVQPHLLCECGRKDLTTADIDRDLIITAFPAFVNSPSDRVARSNQLETRTHTSAEWNRSKPSLVEFMHPILSAEASEPHLSSDGVATKKFAQFMDLVQVEMQREKDAADAEVAGEQDQLLRGASSASPFSVKDPTLPPLSVLFPHLVEQMSTPDPTHYQLPFTFQPKHITVPSMDKSVCVSSVCLLSHIALLLTSVGFMENGLIVGNECVGQLRSLMETEGFFVFLVRPELDSAKSSLVTVYLSMLKDMDTRLRKKRGEIVPKLTYDSSESFLDSKTAPKHLRKEFREVVRDELIVASLESCFVLIQLLNLMKLNSGTTASQRRLIATFKELLLTDPIAAQQDASKLVVDEADRVEDEAKPFPTELLEKIFEIPATQSAQPPPVTTPSPLRSFVSAELVRTMSFYFEHSEHLHTFHHFFPSEQFGAVREDKNDPTCIHLSALDVFQESRYERLRKVFMIEMKHIQRQDEVVTVRVGPSKYQYYLDKSDGIVKTRRDETEGVESEGEGEGEGEGKTMRVEGGEEKPKVRRSSRLTQPKAHRPHLSLPIPRLPPPPQRLSAVKSPFTPRFSISHSYVPVQTGSTRTTSGFGSMVINPSPSLVSAPQPAPPSTQPFFRTPSLQSPDSPPPLSPQVIPPMHGAAGSDWSGRLERNLRAFSALRTPPLHNDLGLPFFYDFDDRIDSFLFDTSL